MRSIDRQVDGSAVLFVAPLVVDLAFLEGELGSFAFLAEVDVYVKQVFSCEKNFLTVYLEGGLVEKDSYFSHELKGLV